MMRVLFGLVLALLVAYPPLFNLALSGTTKAASYPPLLAFAVGVLLWPDLARRVKGWVK
ncbi:hypothetical protein [Streptomyces populi]|uniref:hypothetical protein n=1 Tax=Streptomyces populi TaxID=2058924 RepID=UPI00142E401A|nr:hypothetical protein [Streptomyces populi]